MTNFVCCLFLPVTAHLFKVESVLKTAPIVENICAYGDPSRVRRNGDADPDFLKVQIQRKPQAEIYIVHSEHFPPPSFEIQIFFPEK